MSPGSYVYVKMAFIIEIPKHKINFCQYDSYKKKDRQQNPQFPEDILNVYLNFHIATPSIFQPQGPS